MGAVPVATAGDVGAPTGLPLAVFGRAGGVGGGLVGTFGRSPVGVGGGDGGFVVIFGEGGRVTIFGDGGRVTGGGLGGGESFVSTITFSSALRASDPGGGGGTVRGFLRGSAGGDRWAWTRRGWRPFGCRLWLHRPTGRQAIDPVLRGVAESTSRALVVRHEVTIT